MPTFANSEIPFLITLLRSPGFGALLRAAVVADDAVVEALRRGFAWITAFDPVRFPNEEAGDFFAVDFEAADLEPDFEAVLVVGDLEAAPLAILEEAGFEADFVAVFEAILWAILWAILEVNLEGVFEDAAFEADFPFIFEAEFFAELPPVDRFCTCILKSPFHKESHCKPWAAHKNHIR